MWMDSWVLSGDYLAVCLAQCFLRSWKNIYSYIQKWKPKKIKNRKGCGGGGERERKEGKKEGGNEKRKILLTILKCHFRGIK